MRRIRALLARIAGLRASRRAEREMAEELEAHLEMVVAENLRRGLSPAEARRQALLASGGLTQAAEAVRAQRGLPWVQNVGADLRYAVRALRHGPAFTAVVVLTLALGIGANTAIFSVVRAVLLKPLPNHDGDRLMYLRQSADGPARASLEFSVPEIHDLREGAPSLAGIAELSPWFATLQTNDGARRLDLGLVTGNYFDVMGLTPILGRLTGPEDDGLGAPPVAVLTRDAWVQYFGADSSLVGHQIRLDGRPVTVIGVVESAPLYPVRADAFLNMVFSAHHVSATMIQGRTHRMTEVVARLAPGAGLAEARAQVATVYARMLTAHPDAYDPAAHYRISVVPFQEALGERARLTLWLLMGAAAFALVITIASVANLTLMRGIRREHELVVRVALGAGTGRLRRLLLAENLLLALAGGAAGVLLAMAGLPLLTALAARYSPRAGEIRLDRVVLGFAFAVSAAVAVLHSFLTSLPTEGTVGSVSSGGRRVGVRLPARRLQRVLVVLQVAVSVMLLAGAGLLTRTLVRLADVDTGLSTEEILSIPLPLLDPTKLSPATDLANKSLYHTLQRELRTLPGVVDVGLGSTMPLRNSAIDFDLKAEGRPPAPGAAIPQADLRTASPEFFHAAGIPLLAGRVFGDGDGPGAERVVVVNRTLADQLFPGEDPLGHRIAFTGDVLRFTPFSGDWRTIVGVVGDTRDGGPDAPRRLVVFAPFDQEFAWLGGFVIRSEADAGRLVAPATKIVRRLAPTVPLENVLTVAEVKDQSVAPQRLNARLVSWFALLAALIAAVGIAGVLAFSVSVRTGEIGIRMTLGADRARVRRMILREGGGLLAIGLGLGTIGALAAGRIIRGLLFGVTPTDPVTLGGVALVMTAIGIAACWVPAARAARIDPAITLRS
jgi:putative ABC transport system permease protein